MKEHIFLTVAVGIMMGLGGFQFGVIFQRHSQLEEIRVMLQAESAAPVTSHWVPCPAATMAATTSAVAIFCPGR